VAPQATPGRRLVPFSVALAGVVLAHTIGYAVVFREPVERAERLRATGHAYWPLAAAGATLLALVAVIAALARGAARAAAPGRTALPRLSFATRVARLASAQIAVFVVMESAERLGAGMSPAILLERPEFWLGLGLQVVVASAALLVLAGLERAATAVVASRRSRFTRPRSTSPSVWAQLDPALTGIAVRSRSRAPPALAHT